MKRLLVRKRILIVDRQKSWRDFSSKNLQREGFSVRSFGVYDHSKLDLYVTKSTPDLVVLGCSTLEPPDQEIIKHILRLRVQLLVVCTSPTWPVLHSLFREGVADVADKSYDPARLLQIVKETLESSSPRSSYEAVLQQGLS
jgi:Response regulator containing CheY-like receiver, AAA-type ATPase, and DNA-binding domains